MSDDTEYEARIEALEIRSAHQEMAIDDLSKIITDQWKLIETLKRKVALIDDQIAAVEQIARTGTKEAPPPHY